MHLARRKGGRWKHPIPVPKMTQPRLHRNRPVNRGPSLTEIEAMILSKAPLSGNEDVAECNSRSSNEAWRVLSTMNDSPDVNFLKGLYQTICKVDDDTASRYYSQVGGKAKVRAWNTWASDYE